MQWYVERSPIAARAFASEVNACVERVKDLLGDGRLKAAHELLERALQQYPTNERLLKLHWAVPLAK